MSRQVDRHDKCVTRQVNKDTYVRCAWRQIKDEYTVVLTLTDHKLGDGQFITQSMLLLVEDINDNEPVFRPYESSLLVDENAPPQVLTKLLATDQDEGPFGQVRGCWW